MRRNHGVLLLGLLGLLTACRPGGRGPLAGAASPEGAVTAFLSAAAAQDLQAMSLVWGTARGPVRNTMERSEMERRQLVMIRLLCQDGARPMGTSTGTDGRRLVRYELALRGRTQPVTFTTVPGPQGRWFVEDLEVLRLQELCIGR
jgi:hypothetical protein